MDYRICPHREVIRNEGTKSEIVLCKLTTAELLGHTQGYCVSICIRCSEGLNPQTLESPTLQDLVRRTCRRAFTVDTSKVGTTSPEIRRQFLKKIKALGESEVDMEQLLAVGVTKGVIVDEAEDAALYEEIHRE